MEVEMTIRGLLIDPVSNMPIVILKDVAGESVVVYDESRRYINTKPGPAESIASAGRAAKQSRPT